LTYPDERATYCVETWIIVINNTLNYTIAYSNPGLEIGTYGGVSDHPPVEMDSYVNHVPPEKMV
jgi:hypothetical protein